MSISINSNKMFLLNSPSFGCRESKKSEQKSYFANNNISKSTSDAIKAAVLPAISKPVANEGIPNMPTFESVTEELKEPLVVGGKVVFAPKNEKKFDLGVLNELVTNSKKGVVELEKSNKYSNFKMVKSSTGYVLGFEYPSKNSADKKASYFMCVKNDGRTSFASKETVLMAGPGKEVKKEVSVRSLGNNKPLPNQVMASVNYELSGPRSEWAINVGVDYELSSNGKIQPNKYKNEIADIMPESGKQDYFGDINDVDVISFFRNLGV